MYFNIKSLINKGFGVKIHWKINKKLISQLIIRINN